MLPRIMLSLVLLAGLAGTALAQDLPTSQPGFLTINIEQLKVGVGADHETNEAGWPRAFAQANFAYPYLALESLTGTPEIWFVAPYASWSAEGESMKAISDNAALSAEMAKLAKADAQYLDGYRTLQAMARPDLSQGQYPDIAMARFFEITVFRVRPGHERGFEEATKVYKNVVERSAPGTSFRTYQVTGGMPGGTYLVFGSTTSYAEFDKQLADYNGIWAKATAEEMTTLQQTMANDVLTVTSNRYRVSPTMSYVPAETKAKDPAFWK
jgi:hypothetical protein